MWLLAINYLSYAQARANLSPAESLEASGRTVTPACAGRSIYNVRIRLHECNCRRNQRRGELVGHFLRGHAGSLAYDLYKMGSTWPSDEGINRARHTASTFFKNYYRATNRRTVLSYAAARERGKKLRFEEAARL